MEKKLKTAAEIRAVMPPEPNSKTTLLEQILDRIEQEASVGQNFFNLFTYDAHFGEYRRACDYTAQNLEDLRNLGFIVTEKKLTAAYVLFWKTKGVFHTVSW